MRTSPSFVPLLVLLFLTTASTVHPQKQSFTVDGIKPFEKAVPGQVMEVFIEGLGSGSAPVLLPETDFKVAVTQNGVKQEAKVRIVKFTMISERNPKASNKNTVDFSGMKMRAFHSVSFVVPLGLRPGPAEVVASYKGKRGNPVAMEIVERPLTPIVGSTAVLAVGNLSPERTGDMKIEGNDLGWRLERGTTVQLSVSPLVDPDDPNSAILIQFKQNGVNHEAITRVTSSPTRVEQHGQGVGFFAAQEQLDVDIPAALTLGKAEVEIRIKANGQVSDPVRLTATITDVTRVTEAPRLGAPRVLAVAPARIGAGQSLMISIDQRRALEPSPEETQVVIEQNGVRYFAPIEKNSALTGPSKAPDAPVGVFARTTRQFIGRVQVRVLNPLRGEETGLSAPVTVEIVDEVLPPELSSVNEATDSDLVQLRELYALAKQAEKAFSSYDPSSRYLALKARGVDYNPALVRVTLEQGDKKITLTHHDFSLYSGESLILRLPPGLAAGEVKLTIENSDGDRYSTPVTKTFVLQSGT